MENKNAVLIFTVLLAFATLYTLSFNWASKRFEAKASIHGQYIADSLQENNLLGSLTLEEAEKKAVRRSKPRREEEKRVQTHRVPAAARWHRDHKRLIGEAVDVIVFMSRASGVRRVEQALRITGFDGTEYRTEPLAAPFLNIVN